MKDSIVSSKKNFEKFKFKKKIIFLKKKKNFKFN